MFVESLLESGNVHHPGRGWATTLSITLQALALAALVALPIFRPDRLVLESKSISAPIAFGQPDAPPENPLSQASQPVDTERRFELPREVPTLRPDSRQIFVSRETGPTPTPCVGNCAGPGSPDGVHGGLQLSIPTAPTVRVTTPERVVVSQLALGRLIRQVQPVYPSLAKQAGVEGAVVLRALIATDGGVVNVQVLSGHVLLQESARRAVEQWRYQPYVLNGRAVEVETQITVNFRLNR
jgi:periplasmic protein TonB